MKSLGLFTFLFFMLASLIGWGQKKNIYTLQVQSWAISNIGSGSWLDSATVIVRNANTNVEINQVSDTMGNVGFKLGKAKYEVICTKSGYDTAKILVDFTKKSGQFVSDKDLKKCCDGGNNADNMGYTLFMHLKLVYLITPLQQKSGVRIIPHKDN